MLRTHRGTRWILWTSVAVLASATLLGLARNDGNKFVRTLTSEGCLSSYANVTSAQRAIVCCTGKVSDEGVCIGGRNQATRILTSKWAFVIPLLAVVVNAGCDFLAGGATPARTRARWNRFWLYIAIILVRTGGLYMGLNYIQALVQRDESKHCWYAHLRRSGKCSEQFDFADHVVLGVCQYFAIQVFELHCVIREFHDRSLAAATAAAAAAAGVGSSKAEPPRPGPAAPSPLSILPPVAVCIIVAWYALVLMYDTMAFFHTREETVAALVLSWFFVGSPGFRLMGAGGRGGRTAAGLGAGAIDGLSRGGHVFLASEIDLTAG